VTVTYPDSVVSVFSGVYEFVHLSVFSTLYLKNRVLETHLFLGQRSRSWGI